MGKSGEEEDSGMFKAAPLLLSGVACAPRPMVIVVKVLKGVKALAVSGLADTPEVVGVVVKRRKMLWMKLVGHSHGLRRRAGHLLED
uniref:Uncharacterized protein n=1 Tax=Knipowitschia caucasica TaxID=637954 RepID=A0AAV2IYK0_KNICA